MSDLRGLPDFQSPLAAGPLMMFAPFGTGSYSLIPCQFVVAQDSTGKPNFTLVLLKRADDVSAAGQYAVLDLVLAGDFPVDDALAAARASAADATVKPISINGGFARLYPTTDAVSLPPDVVSATPLGWAGPDLIRWTARLTVDSGELLKGALSGGALLFGARIEFEVIGVSPRLPITIEFKPSDLLTAMLAGKQGRQISTSDMTAFFSRPIATLPVKVVGTIEPPSVGLFPAAMADRVAAAYGSLVPSMGPTAPPSLEITAASEIAAETVRWDLSEAIAAPRHWAMTLDPLTSLRGAAQAHGIEALVRTITIPPLDLGFRSIDIAANLPPKRVGVPAIGVNVEVAANPPMRPNRISQTLTFHPSNDEGTVRLHLSPDEPIQCSLSTFAVVVSGRSVRQYDGAPRPLQDGWIQLQGSDFPVTFAHLTATDRLLKLADLSGILRYRVGDQNFEQQVAVTANAPDIAVAVPKVATDAVIALSAAPKDGGAPLPLPPMAPGRLRLDVTSFREYGPHTVSITCAFDSAGGYLALDLVSEEDADSPDGVTTRVLTPATPAVTWGYTTASPFRSGYKYRRSVLPGQPPSLWSAVLSPFAPLVVKGTGP